MGTIHPEVDYSGTRSREGGGLDVWVASLKNLLSSQARGYGEGRVSFWMLRTWSGELPEACGLGSLWANLHLGTSVPTRYTLRDSHFRWRAGIVR